jgi:pyrimidine operon attenuation protein/uracil phosphoribosyltransferase
MPDRPQKITLADMRDMGVRGLPIYCSDYKCSHLTTMSGDRWPRCRIKTEGFQ